MGKRVQKSEISKQVPTRKTKAAMDRCQSNRMLRQCLFGIAQRPPHHTIAVPTSMQNRVIKTMSIALPLGNNQNKRSPTLSLAQHHLPALDLFWASFFVRVQLTSLLLISPGLLRLQGTDLCCCTSSSWAWSQVPCTTGWPRSPSSRPPHVAPAQSPESDTKVDAHWTACSLVVRSMLHSPHLLGGSGEVVNSPDFFPASLKPLGSFYFWCILSSQ